MVEFPRASRSEEAMDAVEYFPIDQLRPLEMVFQTHLEILSSAMNQTINRPLIASEEHNIILDGSHRYAALLRDGYRLAPVIFVRYDSPDVRVGTKLKHRFEVDGHPGITKEDCVKAALSGQLLPPRSTRHFFPFRKQDHPTPLVDLCDGEPRSIDHLLWSDGPKAEIQHNRQYLAEIDEEVSILLDYLEEVRDSRRYIEWQLNSMTKTVLFPGKFTPLHEGHLQTIQKLSETYNVKVLVTGDGGLNLAAADVLKSLGFRVHTIPTRLVGLENTEGLPDFDILLSGNPEVLEWASKMGIPNELVERSGPISGRDL